MTSRKDYVAIAAILNAAHDDDGLPIDVGNVVHDLADHFAADNPRFDRERFIKASGC